MRVHLFQSPFKHWLSGLLAEVAVILAFMGLVALLVTTIVWIL